MKLERFLSDLGSAKGAPGGGAAAALAGSMGAALVEMTARLNDKRLGKSSGTASKASSLRKKLYSLIAEDERAFAAIQKAWPARKTKVSVWQSALKKGTQPPTAVAEACAAAALLAKKEQSRTSAWLESDRREALILLGAAFDSAVLNVEVNLKSLEDARFNASARQNLARLEKDVR